MALPESERHCGSCGTRPKSRRDPLAARAEAHFKSIEHLATNDSRLPDFCIARSSLALSYVS